MSTSSNSITKQLAIVLAMLHLANATLPIYCSLLPSLYLRLLLSREFLRKGNTKLRRISVDAFFILQSLFQLFVCTL